MGGCLSIVYVITSNVIKNMLNVNTWVTLKVMLLKPMFYTPAAYKIYPAQAPLQNIYIQFLKKITQESEVLIVWWFNVSAKTENIFFSIWVWAHLVQKLTWDNNVGNWFDTLLFFFLRTHCKSNSKLKFDGVIVCYNLLVTGVPWRGKYFKLCYLSI